MKQLKLYVWKDVLTDYSSGIAFALAENEEEARQLVIDDVGRNKYCEKEFEKKPECVDTKKAFHIYGGG